MSNCRRLAGHFAGLIVTLTGCSTQHEFRVGSVGDPAQQSSESSATAQGSPLVVAAGNVLLGPASQITLVNGPVANSGVVQGTVGAVLLTTGQSLIELSDGTSLVVNGAGGALGDLVSVDRATGQVVGGSSTLIGANVLGTTSSGTVTASALGSSGTIGAGATVGRGALPTISASTPLGSVATPTTIGPVTGTISGASGTLSGTLGPLCC